jgi:glycosyltransferase 2 family protein
LNTATQNALQKRPKLLLFVGYGLATICLIWVLHDFHIVRELRNLAKVSWEWVLLGMACDVLSYGIQAVRWKFLLAPFGKVRLGRSIRAVFTGLFANLVFPLRPGEVLRSYLLANSEEISMGRVLGAVGVERFLDLVIATAALSTLSLASGDFPRDDRRIADILGYVTLFLLLIVGLLILWVEIKLSGKTPVDSKKAHLPSRFMNVLTDLHAIGTAPSFYAAVLTSMAIPLCQVLGLWAVMRAYGLTLSLLSGAVVLLIINLGVSLPNAPANVGSYQFFCVLGLSIFDVEKTRATGFSIFAFLALTIPLAFLGFAALLRSGLSFHSMREKVKGLPSRARA